MMNKMESIKINKILDILHNLSRKFASEFAFNIDKGNKIKFLFVNLQVTIFC